MRHLHALLLTLCFALAAPLRAQPNPFEATVETVRENRVPLRIHPANNLQTLQATLNGKPCTLLFDTGASHTTFNAAFIASALPDLPRQPLILPGQTNVRQRPDLIPVASLTLGNTSLRNFYAMVLPLDHLSRAVGTPIDGILGANSIAYAPCLISLRQAAVTWAPAPESLPEGLAEAPTLPPVPPRAPPPPPKVSPRILPPPPSSPSPPSARPSRPSPSWPAANPKAPPARSCSTPAPPTPSCPPPSGLPPRRPSPSPPPMSTPPTKSATSAANPENSSSAPARCPSPPS